MDSERVYYDRWAANVIQRHEHLNNKYKDTIANLQDRLKTVREQRNQYRKERDRLRANILECSLCHSLFLFDGPESSGAPICEPCAELAECRADKEAIEAENVRLVAEGVELMAENERLEKGWRDAARADFTAREAARRLKADNERLKAELAECRKALKEQALRGDWELSVKQSRRLYDGMPVNHMLWTDLESTNLLLQVIAAALVEISEALTTPSLVFPPMKYQGTHTGQRRISIDYFSPSKYWEVTIDGDQVYTAETQEEAQLFVAKLRLQEPK